jgi:hypothetical protein
LAAAFSLGNTWRSYIAAIGDFRDGIPDFISRTGLFRRWRGVVATARFGSSAVPFSPSTLTRMERDLVV